MPVPAPADHRSCQGLAWTYDLDLEQLLATLGASQLGEAGDERAAAEEAAAAEGAEDARVPPRELTGAVADQLPPGPGLAAWVGGTDPAAVGEWDLPGVASAFRRLAAWAQAGELAAVAQMASRSAGRDDHVHVDADGRPDQVTPAAGSEVGLELVMSHPAAMAWASLAVTLRWRLHATWAALNAGTIDLYRARLIAEATSPLDDETARAVEANILPSAGQQTSGQLRAALRRAVIAADPEGAEQRRKDAQRHAKVSLYPDPADGTATLAGTRLPSVHAAAAMARLTAMARAMKSAGQAGGLDYLRATAFIGLLLGTLPLVPPPAGDPGPAGPTDPDPGPPSDDHNDLGRGPGPGGVGPANTSDTGGTDAPRDSRPDDPDLTGATPSGPAPPGDPRDDHGAPDDRRDPQPDDPGPPGDPGGAYADDEDWDDGPFAPGPPAAWPPLPATTDQTPPFLGQPPPSHPPPDTHPPPRDHPPPDSHPPPDGHPPPRDHPPPDSHPPPGSDPSPPGRPPPPGHPPPASRPLPPGQPGRPPRGLLDLVISWRALNGDPAGPATLSRAGPITASQALPLALTAATDPHARWQVILTDADGYAIATETIRRHTSPATRPAGVTGQVTVTIPAATLDQPASTEPASTQPASTQPASHPPASTDTTGGSSTGGSGRSGTGRGIWSRPGGGSGGGILAAVLRAARRARTRAQQQAAADAAAPGGCAHTTATSAYRPTPAIRDYVTARDQTCRDPRCRQPARHADLDHATPFDQGGLTCSCNLGPRCRTHHIIKQLPGWTLTQPRPGHFQLTTPTGRTYTTTPDAYPS